MCFPGLSLLPLIASFLGIVTILTSYSIAVSRGDVRPFLPYISDTGTLKPESCIFGLMLNATAYSMLLCGIVRFLQIREHLTHDRSPVRWINRVSLFFIATGSLGLSIVACFQETAVLKVHICGAVLAFLSGVVYCILQIHLSYQLIQDRLFQHKSLTILRAFIAVVSVVAFVMTFLFARLSHPKLPPYDDVMDSHDGDEALYLTSTCTEWILALCFFSYIATFAHEFSHISISFDVSTHYRGAAIFAPDSNDVVPAM